MKTIILSLGGSVIVPDEIDVSFLRKLKIIIDEFISKKNKIIIFCGGGKIARKYQSAAKEFFSVDEENLDWVGILASRLNAQLVHSLFSKDVHPKVIYDPTKKIDFDENVLVCAGWKPGWSTDYDAVLIADNLGTNTVVNMTNVDYVYDKNPKEHKDAKPYEKLSWDDMKKLVGGDWRPGANLPFDPIASKKAAELNIEVVVLGSDLDNFKNFLQNQSFKGTRIK